MSQEKTYYKETVERYCHIIEKNTTFNRFTSGKDRYFECANKEECEKNGGCRHHLFGKPCDNGEKKEG